jgi:hypothetical protein
MDFYWTGVVVERVRSRRAAYIAADTFEAARIAGDGSR